MEIKAIKRGDNSYVVNNIVIPAKNFKEALATYISQTMAGSKIQLPKG